MPAGKGMTWENVKHEEEWILNVFRIAKACRAEHFVSGVKSKGEKLCREF